MNNKMLVNKAKKYFKKFLNKFEAKALILLYHRILDYETDPQLLCVTPENFEKHLLIIKEFYNPVSMADLGRQIRSGKIINKSVTITFDDGYADNLYFAKPILEKYNIPATVFITTGMVGVKKEFWWDELERLLLLPESLPESLTLNINNKIHSWKMKSDGDNNFDSGHHRKWDVTMNETPTLHHKAYRELCNLLRPLNHSLRQKLLDEIAEWSELNEKFRQDYLVMTEDEICTLTEDGLIDVGGHTQTHPVLSSLPYQDQKKEIEENKRILDSILDRNVTGFSYPYGSRSDYTDESISLIKEAGFKCACSNFEGKVNSKADLFQLPRFLVRNWNREEFTRRLSKILL